MEQGPLYDPTAAIAAAFRAGAPQEALARFEAAGGGLFVFHHGYGPLAEVLAAMPDGLWRHNEAVLGALSFHLAKQGRAARAHAHLTDPGLTFAPSARFAIYELLIAIHLGDPVRADDLERWRMAERRLPLAEPLLEGLYYNGMLVLLVRAGRLSEARAMGLRAIGAYRQAEHAYLEHFIHQHLADLSIMEGHLRQGRRHLLIAEQLLHRSGQSYGNEAAIMEIIRLTLDYETGRFSHIPARSANLRAALVGGDSWAEIFHQLGRIVTLSLYFARGRHAALSELELYQADFAQRHGRHSDVLTLLEAEVDRLDHRLYEAQLTLARIDTESLTSPIGTVLLTGLRAALGLGAAGQDDIPGPRARLTAELRRAASARDAERRRAVEHAFWISVKESHAAPFLEQRAALSGIGPRLRSGAFARGHVQLARMARRVIRTIDESYWIPPDLSAAGVTHRQYRVMAALQSGATNKQIARSLGISEANVKYHLSRLYRMTGTQRRGQLLEVSMQNHSSLKTYPE
ncbi:MAG: LuxR C-terminal-related transcriptional regulator [Pseudomonadota bacterium]